MGLGCQLEATARLQVQWRSLEFNRSTDMEGLATLEEGGSVSCVIADEAVLPSLSVGIQHCGLVYSISWRLRFDPIGTIPPQRYTCVSLYY